MAKIFRKSPPVCLLISLIKLAFRGLKTSKLYIGSTIQIENGDKYEIFRHINSDHKIIGDKEVIFLVSFKFARFSHKMNKKLSIIPMLLITGFPGFRAKMYTVNKTTDYWQGIYQWESNKALEEYKKSFVLKMMNKRALSGTVRVKEIENRQLTDYINEHII
jgi:hypothetical protein